MNTVRSKAAAIALAAVAITAGATPAGAQNMSYSQAYQKMLQQRPNMTGVGTDRYLYNKYFRSNPAVSPWISGAVLGGTDLGTAYTATVRPQMEARRANAMAQAQYVQQRKVQGNVGYTMNPGSGYLGAAPGSGLQKPVPATARTNGAYQNHWYGGWAR